MSKGKKSAEQKADPRPPVPTDREPRPERRSEPATGRRDPLAHPHLEPPKAN